MAGKRIGNSYLEWYGEELEDAVKEATKDAVYATLADASTLARIPVTDGGLTPYQTGTMAGNVVPHPETGPVEREKTIVGWFGNVDQHYTLWQELRAKFLRTAADRMFPTLAERIPEFLFRRSSG